jgi:hypothetical protein
LSPPRALARKGLIEVGKQIFDVFDADGHAYE